MVLILFLSAIVLGCNQSPKKLLNRGNEHYARENFPKALEFYKQVFESGINDPQLMVNLAFCLVVVEDDPNSAIQILTDAAMMFPDYPHVYYELGQIAYQYGPSNNNENLIQALEFTRKAYDLDSSNSNILQNLGKFYLMLDSTQIAQKYFNKASLLNPTDSNLATISQRLTDILESNQAIDSIKSTERSKSE